MALRKVSGLIPSSPATSPLKYPLFRSCCAFWSTSGVKTFPPLRIARFLKNALEPPNLYFFNERSTLLLDTPKVRIMSVGLQLPSPISWDVNNLNCLRSFAGWIYIGYAPWKYIQYKSVCSTLTRSQILVRPEGIVGRRSCCAMVSSPSWIFGKNERISCHFQFPVARK